MKISTEGSYPFCDLSYAHCCHRLMLSRYRHFFGGGLLRYSARILTHAWGVLTERIAFSRAKTIVVPSEGLARELRILYPMLVETKIHVLPNPVNCAAFARPADGSALQARQQLAIGDEFVFSFCALGNFEWKGLRLVLQSLACLADRLSRLLIIGGSKRENHLYRAVAEQLRIQNRVHFVGLQNDIRPYLWCSNAFVLPSAYETFSLVCLQAAAASLPLITTPLHGIDEFTEDGVTGWLVARETASIARAMNEAVSDPIATARMGLAALERVKMYDEGLFRERWLRLLAEESH